MVDVRRFAWELVEFRSATGLLAGGVAVTARLLNRQGERPRVEVAIPSLRWRRVGDRLLPLLEAASAAVGPKAGLDGRVGGRGREPTRGVDSGPVVEPG